MDEPFVGRAAELAELDHRFALAAGGQGQVAVVTGPPGVGKTALIGRCLRRWTADAGALLASGDEAEAAISGGLLSQLSAPVLAASALAAVLAASATDPLSAGSAVLGLLREQARARPLIVIVDDAQWADELSLAALSFAVRRLRADRVMCVIATQTDGLARLPPGVMRAAAERGAVLELAGLDVGEVAALAELAGAGRLPGRAAERLREHTAGVPLHVRELLHDLPADIVRSPGATLPAPRSLQALVVSRLALCSQDAEALVVAGAVLGPHFDLADAAALAGLGDPLPALQEAIAQRLLTESSTAGRRRCRFSHALIRAAVYQDMGLSRRAALHRAAARRTAGSTALAHRVAGCPGTDPQLAAELADRAATEQATGQISEATEHLLMAVHVADDSQLADAWLLVAVSMLTDQGDAARAGGYASQIAAMPPSVQRSLVLGRLDLLSGAGGPAEQHIAGGWAALDPDAEPAWQERETAAKAACELALMLMGQHRLDDAATWARRSADTAATEFTRACSRTVQCGSLAAAGHAHRARELLEAELAQATDAGSRALMHLGLGGVLLYADELSGAAAHLTAATTIGQSCLPASHLLEAQLLQVVLAYRRGHWNQAAAGNDRLITLLDDLDQSWLLGRAHLAAVYVAAGRGSWHDASRHADVAAGLPGFGEIAVADARTAIAVARDDPQEIVAAARDAVSDLDLLSRMEPGHLSFWAAYAEALARTGQYGTADHVLRRYEQRAAECGRNSAMAAASRARGVLQASQRNHDGALTAFGTSLAHLDGLGMPFEEAKTRLERGRLLRRAGQRRAAAREISEARQLFAGLDAQPFIMRCDHELGTEPSAVTGPGRVPLTLRQLAVAQAAAQGKTNREIAADLYISVKTVEFHLGQILARLSIDSRAQIARALPAPKAPTWTPPPAQLIAEADKPAN